MEKERFKVLVAAFAILRRGPDILFLRRFQTGYMDGCYSFCAGHVEVGESVREAMVRELYEEIGVKVLARSLRLAHVRSCRAEDEHRLHHFFEVSNWQGEPRNVELEKCDELRWMHPETLPVNMVSYIPKVIRCIENGVFYSEEGWESTKFATSEIGRDIGEAY